MTSKQAIHAVKAIKDQYRRGLLTLDEYQFKMNEVRLALQTNYVPVWKVKQ